MRYEVMQEIKGALAQVEALIKRAEKEKRAAELTLYQVALVPRRSETRSSPRAFSEPLL